VADRLIDLTRELYDAFNRGEKVVRFAIFLDRADAERAAGLRDR
jgi:hypothetical protein